MIIPPEFRIFDKIYYIVIEEKCNGGKFHDDKNV